MKALILGSGLGTRLHPITKITPKPLIDVKGRPILARILEKLEKSRHIDEIYITCNDEFRGMFMKFMENFKYSKKTELISKNRKEEKEMPGSVGTIAFFVKLKNIREDLLVLAADNIFSFDIDDFVDFYMKRGKACVAVHDFKDKSKVAGKYGAVEMDNEGKITGFEEKPEMPKTGMAATLCYIIPGSELHHLGDNSFRENAGELIAHLAKNGDVYGYVFAGKWLDVGTHEDLEKARNEF
jgi:glucose-1-phosphate thymidylyltransferase